MHKGRAWGYDARASKVKQTASYAYTLGVPQRVRTRKTCYQGWFMDHFHRLNESYVTKPSVCPYAACRIYHTATALPPHSAAQSCSSSDKKKTISREHQSIRYHRSARGQGVAQARRFYAGQEGEEAGRGGGTGRGRGRVCLTGKITAHLELRKALGAVSPHENERLPSCRLRQVRGKLSALSQQRRRRK